MQKQRIYEPVRFSAETLRAAEQTVAEFLAPQPTKDQDRSWSITIGDETWTFDSAEEFYADYRRKPDAAFVSHRAGAYRYHFQIINSVHAVITVQAPTRAEIESVFAPLRRGGRVGACADREAPEA